MDSRLHRHFGSTSKDQQAELESVIGQLARDDTAAATIMEAITVRESVIARLNLAANANASIIEAVCEAVDIAPTPAHTLKERLMAQLGGMGERLIDMEYNQRIVITRQQEEIWLRRAELYAALQPRSRWVYLMRVFFPPNPGDIDHLLHKGL